MSATVIVAIPKQGDNVWKVSSEKVPHLTLLYLGENPNNSDAIKAFTIDAAQRMLHTFSLGEDHRGTLGEDNADVLFFQRHQFNLTEVQTFRMHLLSDPDILAAYNAVEKQFHEWTPHLTLGYPEAPAKTPEAVSDQDTSTVFFDRIAIWDGDYEGFEVVLKDREYTEGNLAMSDTKFSSVEDFLAHFGIKGMKWGIRRTPEQLARVGAGPDSPDGVRAKETLARIQSSKSLTSVSNDDLEFLTKRLNLEKRFEEVNPSGLKAGHEKVQTLLGYGQTLNKAVEFYQSPGGRLLRNMLGLAKNSGDPTKPYGRHAKPLPFPGGKKKKK